MKTTPTIDAFILSKGFIKVPLQKNGVGHFELSGKFNGKPARFILDTGASQTVLDKERAQGFDLAYETETQTAGGLGTASFETSISKNNTLEIDKLSLNDITVAALDLSHVNKALISQDAEPVDGVLGADVLSRTNAIINYGLEVVYCEVPSPQNKAS